MTTKTPYNTELSLHPETRSTDSDVTYQYDVEHATSVALDLVSTVMGYAEQAGIETPDQNKPFALILANADMTEFYVIEAADFRQGSESGAVERYITLHGTDGLQVFSNIRYVQTGDAFDYVISDPSTIDLSVDNETYLQILRGEAIRIFAESEDNSVGEITPAMVMSEFKERMSSVILLDFEAVISDWLTDEFALEIYFKKQNYLVDHTRDTIVVLPDNYQQSGRRQKVEVTTYPYADTIKAARDSIQRLARGRDRISLLKLLRIRSSSQPVE